MAPLTAVNNSMEVGFTEEDVITEIKSLLKSKQWGKINPPEMVLNYVPYFVFRYVAYNEEQDEESKKPPIVTDANHGIFVLDALSGELEIELSDNFENPTLVPFRQATEDSDFSVNVQKPSLSHKEAEKVALLKTAKQLELPKKNVEISSMRLVYVPVWNVNVSIPDGDFELDYSGVDGELLSEDTIPERIKEKGEVANEAISELTDPRNWGTYAQNLIRDIYESEHLRNVGKFLLHDSKGRIILTIILLYLVLRLLGFRWP